MIQRTHPNPVVHAPDMMPVLSRGKHRSPKKGACFMELASFLAGEPWSDHPSCTHPLLASLARDVNDHVDDYARTRLAPLIPEVIGLNGTDLTFNTRTKLAEERLAVAVTRPSSLSKLVLT